MLRKRPDAFTYYLDANLDGPDLVRTLRDAGVRCEAHRDHFPGDAADEDWMPVVAASGWVIVTRDFAIKRRPAEREAWTNANAIIVMLRAAHADARLDNYLAKRSAPMVVYLTPPAQLAVHFGGQRRGARKKG
jgi:predicted nuclease of predicted toxin-antitoxin system